MTKEFKDLPGELIDISDADMDSLFTEIDFLLDNHECEGGITPMQGTDNKFWIVCKICGKELREC